jgi:DNA invertase Pin-like site-specific DNA recombinase
MGDTTRDVGRLVLAIMGGIAEFERELIRQRCQAGIDRAKRKGTKFGRPIVHACHCRWCQREIGTAHALNALYAAE